MSVRWLGLRMIRSRCISSHMKNTLSTARREAKNVRRAWCERGNRDRRSRGQSGAASPAGLGAPSQLARRHRSNRNSLLAVHPAHPPYSNSAKEQSTHTSTRPLPVSNTLRSPHTHLDPAPWPLHRPSAAYLRQPSPRACRSNPRSISAAPPHLITTSSLLLPLGVVCRSSPLAARACSRVLARACLSTHER